MLDSEFAAVAIIDEFDELHWNRRYYECGSFRIICPDKYYSVLERGAYVCRADRRELGVIDGYTLADGYCTIRGMFAKYLLSRRVMYPTAILSGNAEAVLCDLVAQKLGISTRAVDRPLFGDVLDTRKTGGSLLDFALTLGKQYDFSFDIEYSPVLGKPEFVVWRGTNRSRDTQSGNWIEFSAEWENLADFSVLRSDREYKNVAVVAGMGRGAERICTIVDICGDNEERRELWVDAKDLQNDGTMTREEYVQLLRERGMAKLFEHAVREEFSASSEDSLFSYPDDYDLGDTVTVSDSRYSLSTDCKIIGIDEVINNGVRKIELKFSNGTISRD